MAILFLEDWKKYPESRIHYETKNTSALELAAKLRMMGVENNAFFLALHNPDLADLDPLSEDLTSEQQMLITIEIKSNPWYYFREIGRVPALAGGVPGYIEFNRANIALWWCFFNHVTVILTQPRQTGKSFSSDHLSTYLTNFRCTSTTIHLITKDDKLRAENIERLKKIYGELPAYLSLKTREDVNNTEEFTIKALGNAFKAHVPRADEKGANNLGRGMTTPILVIDEGPFQKNLDIALPAAVGAMGAAIDSAKKNDEPYGLVFTTTAGRKDEKEGAYFYGMVEASAPFTEKFYDMPNEEGLREFVKKNGRGNYRTYICFSHIQLGKDDAWLYERITAVPTTPEQVNRDFFNVWTSGNSSSPFDISLIEKVAKSERDPDFQGIESNGYVVRWYLPQDQLNQYMTTRDCVVGIDTSDAVGKDDISAVFVDARTGATVGAAGINETNLIKFAMFLVDLIIKYPKITLVPERRGSANTIIDYLLLFLPKHGIDPFKRVFNWVVNNPEEFPDLYEQLRAPVNARSDRFYDRCKTQFGYATSGSGKQSRDNLYSSTILSAIKRNASTVYDRKLSGQIRGLQVRNGRVDHAIGEHDDHVIAWLMSHWFLTFGKNLSHYGIDSAQVLAQAVESTKARSAEERLAEHLQQQIRLRINTLFEKMSQENNSLLLERMENEVRQLDRQLVLKDGEVFSVDRFMSELREKRKQNRLGHHSPSEKTVAEQMGYYDGRISPLRLGQGTIVM